MDSKEHRILHAKGRKTSEETKRKLSLINKNRIPANRKFKKEDILNIVNTYIELKCYRKVDRKLNLYNGCTGDIIRGNYYSDYQNLIKEMLTDKID